MTCSSSACDWPSGTAIEAAGEGVRRFAKGERVYTSGTLTGAYAEAALCKEAEIHPLPDRVSFEQGAAMGVPYATAYRALFQKARALPGEVVLVHGATGGVRSLGARFRRR